MLEISVPRTDSSQCIYWIDVLDILRFFKPRGVEIVISGASENTLISISATYLSATYISATYVCS